MADIVIKSNNIFTGLDEKPISGAVVVDGNKITAVVTDCKEVDSYVDDKTTVYWFGDKLVMPGLIDSHLHLSLGGSYNSELYLTGLADCKSAQEVLERVKAFAEEHPDYPKYLCNGFFMGNWDNPHTKLHRKMIDEIIDDKPVYINTDDGHSIWMNTMAVEECNLNGDNVLLKEDIEYDEEGATGVGYENGWMANCYEQFCTIDPVRDIELRQIALDAFRRNGITMVGEMSGHFPGRGHDFEVLLGMEEKGLLTVRIDASVPLALDGDYTENLKLIDMMKDSNLMQCNNAKLLLDGVTTTHTAALLAPYTDAPAEDPGFAGKPLDPYDKVEIGVLGANKVGLQARLHCIGDGAVHNALNMYEKSEKLYGCADKGIRNSIEHIETISPADIRRFAEIGVCAAIQPEHVPLDFNDQEIRLGRERWAYGWMTKSIMDTGAHVSFGSDYPVVQPNPYRGIYFAMTRRNFDGTPAGINGEAQKVDLATALKAYTIEGAYASRMEDKLGTLEPGKLADITVASCDLFSAKPEEIMEAASVFTMVDGKVVYQA